MTTFDDRDKGFENKFAHDEELTFKATALANRMLAHWAAEKMGKTEAEAKAYAESLMNAHFGNDGLEGQITDDLSKAGIPVSPKDLQKELARLLPLALNQIKGFNE